MDALPLRVYEYWLAAYRRTWRGSFVTTVLTPALFLGAMGGGLGSLVDASTQGLGGLTYLDFVAPGLLAMTAMQVAAGEASYPVMVGLKWRRTYHAALATPIGPSELLLGHLLWMLTRVAMACTAFLVVATVAGAVGSPLGLLALPAAVLTGAAFAGPVAAFSVTRKTDAPFAALFRFGIVPMFLFSGTFVPVERLPAALEVLAWVTPLWHGVALCRDLTTGHAALLTSVGHTSYLVVWALGGLWLATRAFRSVLYR